MHIISALSQLKFQLTLLWPAGCCIQLCTRAAASAPVLCCQQNMLLTTCCMLSCLQATLQRPAQPPTTPGYLVYHQNKHPKNTCSVAVGRRGVSETLGRRELLLPKSGVASAGMILLGGLATPLTQHDSTGSAQWPEPWGASMQVHEHQVVGSIPARVKLVITTSGNPIT